MQSRALVLVAKRVAAGLAKDLAPQDSPLWLHLVKPYGWLGALGWEAELEPAIERSVVRLPDFIEKARENPETLDAAVCSDLTDDPASVAQLDRVIREILKGSPRPKTKVHVFARPANSQALRAVFGGDSRVWVAPPLFNIDVGTGASPWLSTMCYALRERSIDVAHFISHGAIALERPRLCFADPDEKRRTAITRSVSTGEMALTLIKLGAWAAILTLPRDASDFSVRWFADSLAQASPSVVAYDEEGGDLAQIYGFLFAKEPVAPPRLGRGFLYCQPAMTTKLPQSFNPLQSIEALAQNADLFKENATKVARSATSFAAPLIERFSTAFPAVAKTFGLPTPLAPAGDDATPTWIAAAQRYVEARALQVLRKDSLDPLLADSVKSAFDQTLRPQLTKGDEVATRTLSQIQEIVARYAKKESL